MRPIWSGVLSFGLINIPIKVYSATAGVEMDLRMLHKTDLSPIRYAKVCRKDGKELSKISSLSDPKAQYIITKSESQLS